ncbi:hypothetical protein [Vulcanococcus sp. Clear-D1]|nr:hypothetical protein [Vulcanococcus sp. Clear-D1]
MRCVVWGVSFCSPSPPRTLQRCSEGVHAMGDLWMPCAEHPAAHRH